MATENPRCSDEDLAFARLTQKAASNAVTLATRKKRAAAFGHWKVFCAARGIEHTLEGHKPCEILLAQEVYIGRYRLRQLKFQRAGDDVLSGAISGALSAVGSAIARVVDSAKNPFLLEDGLRWHVSIRDAFRGYSRADPPPGRQWPVTISMLHHLTSMSPPPGYGVNKWRAIQDLCVVAFFFLMRPSEFCKAKAEKGAPFRLKHIKFHHNNQRYLGHLLPTLYDATPGSKTAVAVEVLFADQKNGHKGENMTLRPTKDDFLCPVKALVRRCHDLKQHGVSEQTQYHMFWDEKAGHLKEITNDQINLSIGLAAAAVYKETGIDPKKVTASSFRPGGATALLCGKVDKDVIKLLGRWRSDAIDTYLRTQATSLTADHTKTMLKHGNFSFLVKDTLQQEHHLPTTQLNLTKAQLTGYFDHHTKAMFKLLAAEVRELLRDPPTADPDPPPAEEA